MNCLCGLCVQYGCECTITGDHTGCLCACGDEHKIEETGYVEDKNRTG